MMSTESTQIDLDWTRLQGRVLEGGFQLDSILSADALGATFKVRVLGDSSANAIAKLFPMHPADADEQVALWESMRQLKNANLSTPLGAGQTGIDDATAAYLVLKRPDEILDKVVRERSLSHEEAGEVLLAAIAALEELHSHGLVHRCVSPAHILAVGDVIKLSVECAGKVGQPLKLQSTAPKYRAPEAGAQNTTPEADVWCLGATLVEVLSQQPCAEDCVLQAEKLPVPFDSLARHCLDPDPQTRARLAQVEALFRSHPPPSFESKKSEPAAASVSMPVPRPRHGSPQRASQVRPAKALSVCIYAAVAVAVVLALIWLIRPKHAPVRSVAAVHTAPPAQPSAWESKTIPPEDAKTVSSPPAATLPSGTSGVQSQFIRGPVWRVVLYAYARSADANSKARWVNDKYPGLNAETFSPSGGSPYLVVVGGPMSRDDAERLRQRVRALGLPRDSYIQNYRQ